MTTDLRSTAAHNHEAAVSLARTALALPCMFSERERLDAAQRAFEVAQAELNAAQAAWTRLIWPGKGQDWRDSVRRAVAAGSELTAGTRQ